MKIWEDIKFFFKEIGILGVIPDKIYLKFLYKRLLGQDLDLTNPKTFNEKLQWLKLHDRNPLYTKMVDKYEVRGYVKEKIGEEYLIPMIAGPWKTADEINFDALPDQFVLKCTHDSGSVNICRDKSLLDISDTRKTLDRCLKIKFYYLAREWPYKNVKPRIIAEQYISDVDNKEVKDYKLHCFNGRVKLILVCVDRLGLEKKVFYDSQWNKVPLKRPNMSSDVEVAKPSKLDSMITIAELFSKEIPFLRVDLYEISGKLYFGELTFFPAGGFEAFEPEDWDLKMGEWLQLPKGI